MGAPLMVVLDILVPHLAKVALIKHDDVVEHLSAKCADQPFNKRILPGIVVGSADFLDTAHFQEGANSIAIDPVVVTEQVSVNGAVEEFLLNLERSKWTLGRCNPHSLIHGVV